MPVAHSLLSQSTISVDERQQALDRIHSDPGIPNDTTTSSFWLRTPHPQFEQPSTQALPTKADVVIIGSGITGTSIACTLLQNRKKNESASPHPFVVMLEARDICSGATGRNGGHILEKADDYADLEDSLGEDAARKIMRFRLAHLPEILQTAEEIGLTDSAQVRKVRFMSAYFSDKSWEAALERLLRFKLGMPEESAEWVAHGGDSVPEELKIANAKGVITGPAGALWPYKFVTGMICDLLIHHQSDFRIENHTAVTAIRNNVSSEFNYEIATSRGIISALHVIHCTEAHVGHLVPGLRGRIFPVRGQMSAQRPGAEFPCQDKHSWVFNYDQGFDYLTQLKDGQMMFGGGLSNGDNGGIGDLGVSTDDELSFNMSIHLANALNDIFDAQSWGRTRGEEVHAMWTGNMAFSADGFPWVGRLPDSATRRKLPDGSRSLRQAGVGSEWVCAGFGGDGMVQAWLCGKALASMLLLQQDDVLDSVAGKDVSRLPEQMLVSEERVEKAVLPLSVADIAQETIEEGSGL